MKTLKLLLLLTALGCLGALMLVGCGGAPLSEDPATKIKNTSQSECKLEGGGGTEKADSNGAVTIQKHHNYIILFHTDVLCNCASQMEFKLSMAGNEIVLTEFDANKGNPADCECKFDLSATISGLEPGAKYALKLFNEDHSILFADLKFTMDDCPDPDWQCQTASDCYNLDLIKPECIGGFTCQSHKCVWECGNDPFNCRSDSDCPAGYYCEMYVYATDGKDANGNGSVDPARPGEYMGMCQAIPQNCKFDSDCAVVYLNGNAKNAAGEDASSCFGYAVPACVNGMCEYICKNYECKMDSDCPPGLTCFFWDYADVGTCQFDPNKGCLSNADCPYGQECVIGCDMDKTDPNGGCYAAPYGTCQPTQQNDCYSDYDCAAGYHCEFYYYAADGSVAGKDTSVSDMPCKADDPSTGCVPPKNGVCVPDYTGCKSDAECGAGYRCVFPVYDCGYDASTGKPYDDCVSGWPTYGYCEAMFCKSDAECPFGLVCEMPMIEKCPEGIPCNPPDVLGICVVKQQSCKTDAECPEGYFCDNFMTNCDSSGANCGGGEGTCVARQTGCVDKSSCPVGSECVQYCGNGWCKGVCEATKCAYTDPATGLCFCGGFAGFACPPYEECVYDDPNCDPAKGAADCMGHCYAIEPMCKAASDCDVISARPDCEGAWSCDYGKCNWNCSTDPAECKADSDCAGGQRCVTRCGNGWCKSYCEPQTEPQRKEAFECEALNLIKPDCIGAWSCENYRCAWHCGKACAANVDCGADEVCINGLCQTQTTKCDHMDAAGNCVCGGIAGFACPPYEECVYDDPNCDPAKGAADCMGHCKAVPQTQVCKMDSECPNGLVCVFSSWCGVGACMKPGEVPPPSYGCD